MNIQIKQADLFQHLNSQTLTVLRRIEQGFAGQTNLALSTGQFKDFYKFFKDFKRVVCLRIRVFLGIQELVDNLIDAFLDFEHIANREICEKFQCIDFSSSVIIRYFS